MNMRDHFDSIAGEYDESIPEHIRAHYLKKRTRLLTREFSRKCDGSAIPPERLKEMKFLDVGCGTGTLMRSLAARGLNVAGADASEGMLEIARRSGSGEVVRADSSELPFPDCSFDGVYCVALLHHLIERDRVAATLSEMARVARPGGKIIVIDHNPANPYWSVIMKKVPQDSGDERLIPADEIVAGLESGGARVARIIKSGFMPDFAPRFLMPVEALIERAVELTPLLRRLTAHNIVIAHKPED